MKLKKLIVLETTVVASVLVLLVAIVNFTSYLGTSNSTHEVSLYIEKEYALGNLTIVPGEIKYIWFNYSSYEPTILLLELSFKSWKTPGNLNVRCNNNPIKTIFATPENPNISLVVATTSGSEWVEPQSSMFGLNEVIFESDLENGFEGQVSYQIRLRGAR